VRGDAPDKWGFWKLTANPTAPGSFRNRRFRKPGNQSKFATNDVGPENMNGFARFTRFPDSSFSFG